LLYLNLDKKRTIGNKKPIVLYMLLHIKIP